MTEINMSWGFRGMGHAKASKVKHAGHKTEALLASLINVLPENIVKGTGKTDLLTNDGKRISLKSSYDKGGRSQICLYGYGSSYFTETINGSTRRMVDCLAVFPETQEEYQSDKRTIKRRLQGKMIELNRYINADKKNMKEFLSFIFFTDHNNKKIDFLIIADSLPTFHVFTAEDVLNAFCENTIVENSTARGPHQTPNLKVLIKGTNENGKYVNLIENEVRTSTLYRKFLAVGNKTKYLFMLSSNINPKKMSRGRLVLYGKALTSFIY